MEIWIQNLFHDWFGNAALANLFMIFTVLLLAALLYLFLSLVALRMISNLVGRTRLRWDKALVQCGVLHRLAAFCAGLLVLVLSDWWMMPDSTLAHIIHTAVHLWLLLVGMLALFALLNALLDVYNARPYAKQMPLRSFLQGVKLVVFFVVLMFSIALLVGKSPALLISGLGAMTAVLMLIFKDPILGFVAGIQLSANRMLSVGDWLEMPKYQADGDVIEINLTTVKICNWDKTITTIPTYALISDSFKNWRGMQESGGRRIMRSLFIDMQSVRFLTTDDLSRLRKAQLISAYIDSKLEEIERFNKEHNIDPESPINGRHLTNLGTFRAYLLAYLKEHPGVNKELIMMVRQLQPSSEGIPIEIYAFTSNTAWSVYEGVQADIFDHILAVVTEFGLSVFQYPAGRDVRALGEKSSQIKNNISLPNA